MQCDDVEGHLMRFVAGRLPAAAARKIDLHVEVCPRCRRLYAEEVELCAAFQAAEVEPLGAELPALVMQRLATETPAPRPNATVRGPGRAAVAVGLLGAAVVVSLLFGPDAPALWRTWADGRVLDELAARSSGLAGLAATLAGAPEAWLAATRAWLARGMEAGVALADTVSTDHGVGVALLTAAAALGCGVLVMGFRKTSVEEERR